MSDTGSQNFGGGKKQLYTPFTIDIIMRFAISLELNYVYMCHSETINISEDKQKSTTSCHIVIPVLCILLYDKDMLYVSCGLHDMFQHL